MRAGMKIPLSVIAGLILVVVLDTFVQISWKFALSGIPVSASAAATTRQVFSGIFFYLALLALGAQFFSWMHILSKTDLSFALPITALSYLTVLAVSNRALHESVSATKLAGVALILVGVYFITRTSYRTASPGKCP